MSTVWAVYMQSELAELDTVFCALLYIVVAGLWSKEAIKYWEFKRNGGANGSRVRVGAKWRKKSTELGEALL